MQYIILQDTSSESLAYEVTQKIAEGWQPVGGVSLGLAPTGWTLFAQAMTKEAE
jgi:hypothetical protein